MRRLETAGDYQAAETGRNPQRGEIGPGATKAFLPRIRRDSSASSVAGEQSPARDSLGELSRSSARPQPRQHCASPSHDWKPTRAGRNHGDSGLERSTSMPALPPVRPSLLPSAPSAGRAPPPFARGPAWPSELPALRSKGDPLQTWKAPKASLLQGWSRPSAASPSGHLSSTYLRDWEDAGKRESSQIAARSFLL